MRIAVITFVILVLSGCASMSYRGQAQALVEKGDLTGAAPLLERAIQSGDMGAWNDLGVVNERMGNRAQAIQLYTMGARWGDTTAQRNLINLGEPVPHPDLAMARAQQRSANAAQSAATLQMMQALQPRPMPQPINCSSYRVGNSVQTNCY